MNWKALIKALPGILLEAVIALIWGIFESFRNLVKDKKLHP
jgi:hypothetical protein